MKLNSGNSGAITQEMGTISTQKTQISEEKDPAPFTGVGITRLDDRLQRKQGAFSIDIHINFRRKQ